MKTIVDNATNTSKFLVADDYSVVASAENTEMGDPSNLDFIIGDLNSNNSTLIEGVIAPVDADGNDDWFGCKYKCAADGTWTAVEGWIDPREVLG